MLIVHPEIRIKQLATPAIPSLVRGILGTMNDPKILTWNISADQVKHPYWRSNNRRLMFGAFCISLLLFLPNSLHTSWQQNLLTVLIFNVIVWLIFLIAYFLTKSYSKMSFLLDDEASYFTTNAKADGTSTKLSGLSTGVGFATLSVNDLVAADAMKQAASGGIPWRLVAKAIYIDKYATILLRDEKRHIVHIFANVDDYPAVKEFVKRHISNATTN